MIAIAWGIIKAFAPYLLIAVLLTSVYFAGGYAVQRKWDLREATIQAESKKVLDDANRKVEDFKKTSEIAAQIINGTYDENTKTVETLNITNNQLLAERLRDKHKTCGRSKPMPSNTSTAQAGDETITGTWELSETTSKGIIDEAKRADEIVENCRTAQSYINSLKALQ